MRKFICILLALITSMSVSACGAQQDPTEEKKPYTEEIIKEEPETTNKEESEEKDYSQYVIAAYQQGVWNKDFDEKIDGKLADVTLVDGQPVFDIVKAVEQYQKLNLVVDWYDGDEEKLHRSLLTYHVGKDDWRIVSNIIFRIEELSSTIQITDEALEQRALYLLDPSNLPIVWWTGGTANTLDVTNKVKKNIPSRYRYSNRFQSVEQMKTQTEHMVTLSYAKELYYLAAEDLYLECEGELWWNQDLATSINFMKPKKAKLQSREYGRAEIAITWENSTQNIVELVLENGIWKLNSTPYVSTKGDIIENCQSEAQVSDEVLEEYSMHLLNRENLPVTWWLAGGNSRTIWPDYYHYIYIDNIILSDRTEPQTLQYCPVRRFDTVEELKLATEQVVSKKYAEAYLYPLEESESMFIEQNGRLYSHTVLDISPGIGDAVSAHMLVRNADTALLEVEFLVMEGFESQLIVMVLEDGLWKLDNTQLDFYFVE